MSGVEWLYLILTFLLGGGLTSAVKTFRENGKLKAEAKSIGLKTPAEVESLQMEGMAKLIEKLQADNDDLREDRNYYRDEFGRVRKELDDMIKLMDEQSEQLKTLRDELDSMER